LLEVALKFAPVGETRQGLEAALSLSFEQTVQTAASLLGNGLKVTSPDTVPFSLWCAARHIDNYEEALWATVSGLGDRDTTCAIVGGVVVLACGRDSIPGEWLDAREPLALRST
jgi:ADP-ribosylglycohydrolase